MSRSKKITVTITSLSVVLIGVIIGIVYYLFENVNQFTAYDDNTTIGNVYLGGLYYNDARDILSKNAFDWLASAEVSITYQGYEMDVDPTVFSFNIPKSVQDVENGKDNTLIVNINNQIFPNYLANIITENQTNLKYSQFDLPKLEDDLIKKVSLMYSDINLDLGNYIINVDQINTPIKSVTITNYQGSFLTQKFNQYVGKMTIDGKKQFSILAFNQGIELDKSIKFTDLELSVISTALFELILYTNFRNISKHITQEIENYPAFADNKKGLEVLVNSESDFTFYNPNAMAYYVTAKDMFGDIQFDLYGVPFLDTIEVTGLDQNDIKYMDPVNIVIHKEIYNGQPLLPGEQVTQVQGINGFRVIIGRKITTIDKHVFYEKVYEDIYNAKNNKFYKNTNKS